MLKIDRAFGGGRVSDVAWSPDGAALYAASSRGLWRYDAANLGAAPQLLTGAADGLTLVAPSPDGTLIAAASQLRKLHLPSRS